eukprot:scpid72981/ scgid24919/ 
MHGPYHGDMGISCVHSVPGCIDVSMGPTLPVVRHKGEQIVNDPDPEHGVVWTYNGTQQQLSGYSIHSSFPGLPTSSLQDHPRSTTGFLESLRTTTVGYLLDHR